jgi:hypothetical protein
MSCKDLEHKLSAYLEDALSPQEKCLVEEHLASCPQCSKAIEDLKKTGKLVREIEEVEPPPWFTQKIMSRVREEAKPETGIIRKLFYPLHIKIPVQALATVLIAVIAFQIYRVGEPEMKDIATPPAAVFEAGKEQTPAAPRKAPEVAPARAVTEKPVRTKDEIKDKEMMALPSPGISEEAIRKEEKILQEESNSSADKYIDGAKKTEAPQKTPIESMKKTVSIRQQEPLKAAPSPAPDYKRDEPVYYAGASREKRGYEAAPAAPQVIGAVAGKTARIGVAVHVTDASAAAGEVETLLKKSGARKIKRQSREEKEVLTAELKAKNLEELMHKLKAIGKTEEKEIPADIRGRDITITIEISHNR